MLSHIKEGQIKPTIRLFTGRITTNGSFAGTYDCGVDETH